MLLLGEHILYVQLVKPHPVLYICIYVYVRSTTVLCVIKHVSALYLNT